ncbi:MAG: peptide deformylase [Eubacteriaceae bacterium]|nr:peptide deformylase [Eubacteriaceae bacterium]
MALREIRTNDDPILRKKARIIETINDHIIQLKEDMLETMYAAPGIGLAANQIGILRRIVVIDIGDGPLTLINPEIIHEEGFQSDEEGCLSLPGKTGEVERAQKVVVKYLDLDGKETQLEAADLLARAVCHEVDHLNGILFTDKVVEHEEIIL